ncbi:hypothetical protein M2266_005926 [Streptomyces sp. SPB162]|nr:hypothetical protein [Streptomyces sp. SPB162]
MTPKTVSVCLLSVEAADGPADSDRLCGVGKVQARGDGDGRSGVMFPGPWPRSRVQDRPGTSAHGDRLSWVNGVRWFRFTVRT